MKKILPFILILGCWACQESRPSVVINYEKTPSPLVVIDADSIVIEGELGQFSESRVVQEVEKGLQIITFTFEADAPAELPPIALKLKFPSIDVNGFWSPTYSADKINYWSNRITSKASRWAPILSFHNNQLENKMTLALSDALNKTELTSYIKEEDVHFYPTIKLFDEKMPKTSKYSVEMRIDTRPKPYYEAVAEVVDWWAQKPEYQPLIVPDIAKRPMYSTWYSYHQNITAEEIVKECKIAKTLGCETVIIDDGWQTLDGNRGYAYTGDWTPDRIPDMKEFVDSVHQTGMKFLLWYSLPFMGEKAKNYERFKGKYLKYWDGQGTYVLDPRYPEVREYIIQTYEKALQDWDLDGFKLDFIGRFSATEATPLTAENGRDFASVNEATDHLMTEVMKRLTAMKPDIMIEFRQPYIGPVMRKYGNLFRAVDCPNNAVVNRMHTTNLRIMAGNTAVHSDMFIWRKEEPVEIAALQILNILYSVPQLSVRLEEIPDQHLNMIRYWFNYWNENRAILLDGLFIPSNPGANYPKLTAIKDKVQITTIFEELLVDYSTEINRLDIVNAKASTTVILDFSADFEGKILIIDCEGKPFLEQAFQAAKGIQKFEVPPSGMLRIER